MAPNIMVGILALLIALVLYSMGTWGAFRAKAINKRHVTFILIGLAFDVLATIMMGLSVENGFLGFFDVEPLADLLHTVVAMVALFGMAAAGIMGWQAVKKNDAKAAASVAKWVVAPWALWVFVFVWGMIARAPRG
jgi:hypothetical protein